MVRGRGQATAIRTFIPPPLFTTPQCLREMLIIRVPLICDGNAACVSAMSYDIFALYRIFTLGDFTLSESRNAVR